ncbi:hypothetical protein PHJA_001052100, partial [Phtheirospermum japonicum]
VATTVSTVAVIYVSLLLKETSHCDRADELLQEPILKTETEENRAVCCLESSKRKKDKNFITTIPSPKDIINLLTSSLTFSLLACIAFFNSVAEAGVQSFLLVILSLFLFSKSKRIHTHIVCNGHVRFAQMLFLPMLSPFIGEEILLIIGLFAGFLSMFLDSIAWSAWVPYVSASLGFIFSVVTPNLRSMVSKQTGPNEQGIAQGCILGIISFAYLVSPIIFSPLSALFMSEGASFHFPGFSIFCIGLAYLTGFILSIFIKIHINSRNRV